jgi:hypothetical protein
MTKAAPPPAPGVEQKIKGLLTDPKDRIRLDDYVTDLLRSTLDALASGAFADPPPQPTVETIASRLKQYEDAISDLLTAVILLGRWGQQEQLALLEKIFLRIAEANKSGGGYVYWQAMRWYPFSLMAYGAGIAALSARNYTMLGPLFLTWLPSETRRDAREPLIVRTENQMSELNGAFKALPAHARHHVPRSEYVFGVLRAPLDQLLYLGESYERFFDEFEIIAALVYADLTFEDRGRVWAAPGRFGYKTRSSGGPYVAFVKDAEGQADSWPFLKLGLFRSSATRFQEIVKGYNELLSRINWY